MAEPKILVVEDEGIEALDLQQRLTNLGYAVDVAVCGEEAIVKTGRMIPDLVLMDIMLSGKIDGVMAAGEIRARFDIPVIYLTAYADEATVQRAKITEPFGYIVKPFKEREVQITIEMALYKYKMEKKVRESEKWFSTMLRSIGDAVIATDNNGLIMFINPVAEGLLGRRTDDVLSKKLTDVFTIINKYTRKPVENPVSKVLKEGITAGLANHTILISRDGREIPIDDSAAPIKDDKGKRLGVILVFRDITEREKAEEAILRAKVEWERTFDAVPDLIAILDERHHIVRVNRAMAGRLGVTKEQCVNLPCFKVVHGTDAPPAFCPHAQTLIDRREHIAEVHEKRLGGDFLVSANPIHTTEGKMAGSVHVARDITERKHMEDELRRNTEQLAFANSELEAFSYTVAHDLRNPLHSIAACLSLFSDEFKAGIGEMEQGALSRIDQASRRAASVISDLLELSIVSRRQVQRKPIDLGAAVRNIFGNLKTAEPLRKVNLEIKSECTADADPGLTEILLESLIHNSWKYTSKLPVASIEFGFVEGSEPPVYYVRDNGAGFDMLKMHKLFKPFQRLHSDKEFVGTGIGLATVKRIVDKHDGRVWAESKIGEGATFFFTLCIDKRQPRGDSQIMRNPLSKLILDDKSDDISRTNRTISEYRENLA